MNLQNKDKSQTYLLLPSFNSGRPLIFLFVLENERDVIYQQQHHEWAKLGCIRGITLTSSASKVFSSSHWINLFLRIVGGNLGETTFYSPANAELKSLHETKLIAQLPRQVNCCTCNSEAQDIACKIPLPQTRHTTIIMLASLIEIELVVIK